MIDEAFFEYATRYLLVPGRRLNNAELLEGIGLNEPLPVELSGMFELSDALGVDALVLTDSEPLLKQWNPYSGRWPLYTDGAFGAQLLSDHRWLQRVHESGAKALHSALHEVSHALWASWGQLGLLSLLSPSERDRFHLAAEACAVVMSDLEGHERLLSSGVLGRYWPAARSKSHAVAFSAIEALAASGLERAGRAEWLFSVYLDERRALPELPKDEGLKVEALAFLIEEARYAEKAAHTVTPAWQRSYWGRPELEAYLRDFVPPAPLTLPHLTEPISSVEGCVAQWEALTLGAASLELPLRAHLRARLTTQRAALKVCELEGLFESYRLSLPAALQSEAQQLIRATRARLLARFQGHLFTPLGSLSEPLAEEHVEESKASLKALETALIERCGGSLCLDHPWLDHLSFAEGVPPLRLSARARLERGEGPRDQAELLSALRQVKAESRLFIKHSDGSLCDDLEGRLKTAHERYEGAHLLIGALELEDQEATRAEVETWLSSLQRSRELWLPYPLSLTSSCPFIDPLVGFRYQ